MGASRRGRSGGGASRLDRERSRFLTKALKLGPGPDALVDDEGLVLEESINSIAAAGITLECDAAKKLDWPENQVTRGQTATFL